MARAGGAEAAAVGPALHADLIPQVVVRKRVGCDAPGAVGLDFERARVAGACEVGDVARDDEGLALVLGPGYIELLGGRGAGAEAQIAGGVPVTSIILVAAGKARNGTGRGEDAGLQLAQGLAQTLLAIVEVVEQIAQEQVEVDAGELLGEHGGRRTVRHGAGECGAVAVHEEALLHADARLREDIAHPLGVLKDRFGPDLARDARERVHLLG